MHPNRFMMVAARTTLGDTSRTAVLRPDDPASCPLTAPLADLSSLNSRRGDADEVGVM
jgi:hypothetical protein